MTATGGLAPAARAFDAIAADFDHRFGAWRSVAAQRRAVRAYLSRVLPQGARVLEIGGGTGEDALWMAQQGYRVTLTDAAPAMVEQARAKLARHGGQAHVAAAESLAQFAESHLKDNAPFDAVFSNFAPLNCVADLGLVGAALARLVRPGGAALLVLFGTFCPGEMLVEMLRGRPRAALRRLHRAPSPARLGGKSFTVTYHRTGDIARALSPGFCPIARLGVGVAVPPSAAEPWISRHPCLLDGLEALDRAIAAPLAMLGDHVLHHFERHDG